MGAGPPRARAKRLPASACLLLFLLAACAAAAPAAQGAPSEPSAEVFVSPAEVRSYQAALVFARVSPPGAASVELEVSVSMSVQVEPAVINLPRPRAITQALPMVPVPWAPGWYVAGVPGLPAGTWAFEYGPPSGPPRNATLVIRSEVSYRLLVNGSVVAEGSYSVVEGEAEERLPPLVISMVHDALRDPSLVEETLGLGPSGWTLNAGESLSVLVVALDDRGVGNVTDLAFEYEVSGGGWVEGPLGRSELMQGVEDLVGAVNDVLRRVEEAVRAVCPDFDLPDVLPPAAAARAEVPDLSAGAYVRFRACAADVDGRSSCSLAGFYYVVNGSSQVRVLVVDPHVALRVLWENAARLKGLVELGAGYQLPEGAALALSALARISEVFGRYGIVPFHHWERLGERFDLYVAWPDAGLVDLLRSEEHGGYGPDVVVLSNLWLSIWDLGRIEVGGRTVLEHLVTYVKANHAGLVVTHGTLSDWTLWLSCEPSGRFEVGARGHVGSSPDDLDTFEERTVAAMLGMPELALWEHVRDMAVGLLCEAPETEAAGLALGSLPLQVPYVPWNGTLRVTAEAASLGWDVPEEVTVTIPEARSEFGFEAYTQVGWQLGMPGALARAAWWHANATLPLAMEVHGRLSVLVENLTMGLVPREAASVAVKAALRHGLLNLHASVTGANITGTVFSMEVAVPELNATLSVAADLGRRAYESVLQTLPVRVVAVSPDSLAAVIAYDKFWDPDGYRSVYFSFEIEAAEGEGAEALLVSAVEWTLGWRYEDVTELLGGLVRAPRELALEFHRTLGRIPGAPVGAEGLVLNEEGYAELRLQANVTGALHVLVAHPTSDRVELTVLGGRASVIDVAAEAEGVTLATVNVTEAGTVVLGLRAGSKALNPAYAVAKLEPAVEGLWPEIILEPAFGHPGTALVVSGVWFAPEAEVCVSFDGKLLGCTLTDPAGSFQLAALVPLDVSPGPHDVRAEDETGLAAEATFYVTEPEVLVEPSEAAAGDTVLVEASGLTPRALYAVKLGPFAVEPLVLSDELGNLPPVELEVPPFVPGVYEVSVVYLDAQLRVEGAPPIEVTSAELVVTSGAAPTERLEALQEAIAELERGVRELSANVSSLREELGKLSANLSARLAELEELAGRLGSALQSLNASVASLDEELLALASELRAALEGLRAELVEANATVRAMVAELSEEVGSLRSKLLGLASELSELREESRGAVSLLESRVEELGATLAGLEAELGSLSEELAASVEDLNSRLEELGEGLEELEAFTKRAVESLNRTIAEASEGLGSRLGSLEERTGTLSRVALASAAMALAALGVALLRRR